MTFLLLLLGMPLSRRRLERVLSSCKAQCHKLEQTALYARIQNQFGIVQ